MKTSTTPPNETRRNAGDDFANQADQAPPGIVAEFWDFLIHNKKWWLTPILLVLLGVGGLIVWSAMSGAAPFIYTLF